MIYKSLIFVWAFKIFLHRAMPNKITKVGNMN